MNLVWTTARESMNHRERGWERELLREDLRLGSQECMSEGSRLRSRERRESREGRGEILEFLLFWWNFELYAFN